ncbi:BQ2448_6811 [Microbotryum intermedium]|uniref:BQ2448_6811 protein n=1 Tax=Microbotryum intermedium TaxID=269621 RepID=A0A238FNL7_9BASI|nr:BQ2448_6811 [Microbotryum intermedium]
MVFRAQVSFTEDLLFLHPGPPDQPTYDPSVEGTVTLYLPKGRTLRHLSVKLQGICSIGFQHRPYETFTCLEKELTLVRDIEGGADTYFERGEHIFSFSILIPSNTAPYERNAYGRVRHFVSAKAKGLGNFGDLKSEDKKLYLVVNPGGAGESQPPPPLDYKFEGASEDLGPYTMALESHFIMIAGLILFRFRLLGPPTPIAIYSIRLKVLQYFTLTTPSDPNYVEIPLPESRTVFLLDLAHPPNEGNPDLAIAADALAGGLGGRSGSQTPRSWPWFVLKSGEEYKVAHLARLLNDNILRGSTLKGIETGIHVRHEIAVEVTYSAWDEDEGLVAAAAATAERERSSNRKGKNKEAVKEYERKLFVVAKPIDIFSCCSWLDSLTLPEYSVDDPISPPDPDQDIPCTCVYTISRIIERHGGFLKEVASEGNSNGLTFATQYKHDEGTSSHPGSGTNSPTFTGERRGRPPVRQLYEGFQSLSLK